MAISENFLPFCGNERAQRYLSAVFEKKRAQVFLFSGPDAVGKKTAAFLTAARFFCEQPLLESTFGCGVCASCKTVIEGKHPDFFVIAPDGGAISIASVRAAKERLAFFAYAGGARGVIIDDAHCLTAEAQSALLKILEEPPAHTFLFLITSAPNRLFETTRSRALEVPFAEVPEEAITEWLSPLFLKKESEAIAALADGRPGLAKQLAGDSVLRKEAEEMLGKYVQISKGSFADQLAFSEKLAGEGDEAIRSLCAFQIKHIRHSLLKTGEGTVEAATSLRTLLDIADSLAATNANRRMIADSIFFAMRVHQSAGV